MADRIDDTWDPNPKKRPKRTPRIPTPPSGGGDSGTSTDDWLSDILNNILNNNSGGGGGGVLKSNDIPQRDALRRMLDETFNTSRDTKLGNILKRLGETDSLLLEGYGQRAGSLDASRLDNEKAEGASTFENLTNRSREQMSLLAESTAMGAGESDQLRAQMQALRNWNANQGDVNRSFFDTERSVNSAVTDLNAATKTARFNLHNQALGDQEQVWTNWYNQRADALTQLGNLEANPYSNAYNEGSTAFAELAAEVGKAWENPGVSQEIKDWRGSAQEQESILNNSTIAPGTTNLAAKKPSGASLRKW